MSRSRCRRLQAAAPPRRPGLSRLSDSSICHLRDASNLLTETLPTAQSETAGTPKPDAQPSFLTSFFFLFLAGLPGVKKRPFSFPLVFPALQPPTPPPHAPPRPA